MRRLESIRRLPAEAFGRRLCRADTLGDLSPAWELAARTIGVSLKAVMSAAGSSSTALSRAEIASIIFDTFSVDHDETDQTMTLLSELGRFEQ